MNRKIAAAFVLAQAWALCVFLAAESRAQAPVILTYQGRIKEAGVPVTGNRQVFFNICNAATAGTCNATATQWVGATNGLFRSTFTLPAAVDLTVGSWWVEVDVVGTGALSPREQLSASPYAIYASSASALVQTSGAPGVFVSTNLFVVNGSSVGVGMMNPQTIFEAGGNAMPAEIRASYLTSTGRGAGQALGTFGFSALKNGATITRDDFATITGIDVDYAVLKNGAMAFSTQISDAMTETMRITGGKVGIGSTNPAGKLDVAGSICLSGASCITSWAAGNPAYGAVGGAPANALYVNASGNVGVAVSTPSATLDVNGQAQFGNGTTKSTFTFGGALQMATNSGITLSGAGANLTMFGGGSIYMPFGGAGGSSIGVGTSNPGTGLHVSSGALVVDGNAAGSPLNPMVTLIRSAGGGGGTIEFGGNNLGATAIEGILGVDNNGAVVLGNMAGNPIAFFTNAANNGTTLSNERMRIDGAGNVGVGTPSPESLLHMSSGTFSIFGAQPGNNTPAIQVGVSTFVVLNNGNVGIGTTNPTYTLSVQAASDVGSVAKFEGVSAGIILQSLSTPLARIVSRNGTDSGFQPLQIDANGTPMLYLTTSGNVGIGTPSPATKLHMSSGTLLIDGLIAGLAQPALQVGVSSFVVTNGGNVGIGTTNPGGSLDVEAAGPVIVGTHLRSTQATAPTVGSIAAGCGASPTATLAAGSTDTAGSLTITAGTAPGAGCSAVITFHTAYTAAPKTILLTAGNSGAASLGAYAFNVAAANFTLVMNTAPAASTAYTWYYLVVE